MGHPGMYTSDCWVHVNKPHNFMDHDPRGNCSVVFKDPTAWVASPGDQAACQAVFRDTNAIHWVSQHHRNPVPAHVIWEVGCAASRPRPEGCVVDAGSLAPLERLFYWLDITGAPAGAYDVPIIDAVVDCETNFIYISQCGSWLRLLLDERMLKPGSPVSLQVEDTMFDLGVLGVELSVLTRTLVE